MFLGIVAPPCKEKKFDGKIYIKRISKTETTQKTSYNQHFDDSYIVNNEIKTGDWKLMCYHPDMTVGTLTYNIEQVYDLDDDISDRLTFTYITHSIFGKKEGKL